MYQKVVYIYRKVVYTYHHPNFNLALRKGTRLSIPTHCHRLTITLCKVQLSTNVDIKENLFLLDLTCVYQYGNVPCVGFNPLGVGLLRSPQASILALITDAPGARS